MHENEDSFAYSFQFVFLWFAVSMVTEKSIAELYRT